MTEKDGMIAEGPGEEQRRRGVREAHGGGMEKKREGERKGVCENAISGLFSTCGPHRETTVRAFGPLRQYIRDQTSNSESVNT